MKVMQAFQDAMGAAQVFPEAVEAAHTCPVVTVPAKILLVAQEAVEAAHACPVVTVPAKVMLVAQEAMKAAHICPVQRFKRLPSSRTLFNESVGQCSS